LHIQAFGRELKLQVFREEAPENLPWKTLEVDVVLECTGLFRSHADATRHLGAGQTRHYWCCTF
jgi:glyceraldehyde 3-phosphate dehydrogenase/D-erythrose 4-phosphate dehydrogenase